MRDPVIFAKDILMPGLVAGISVDDSLKSAARADWFTCLNEKQRDELRAALEQEAKECR